MASGSLVGAVLSTIGRAVGLSAFIVGFAQWDMIDVFWTIPHVALQLLDRGALYPPDDDSHTTAFWIVNPSNARRLLASSRRSTTND